MLNVTVDQSVINAAGALSLDTVSQLRAELKYSPPLARTAAPSWRSDPLTERVARVAEVARYYAADVDRQGRFPAESMEAAKAQGLMGALVGREFGGEGASVGDIAECCYILGQACASTAMIFAMHQTKVMCVVRHCGDSVWHHVFLSDLVSEQWLLASSTTEGKAGGNVRSSDAAVITNGDRISLLRDASVISYGAEADGLVTTARRAPDAAASDQVLVVLRARDYALTRTQGWDTLGMRGTCSTGFALDANGDRGQVLPVSYDVIHAATMVPSAHIFWSSSWAGIAAAATETARRFVRKAARASEGNLPPAAGYVAKSQTSLRALRALISTTLSRFETIKDDRDALVAIDFQTRINLLKVDASELAVATVMSAMRACGLAGYRNDSEWSIGRHLRDVLSSPIMINNDRILANLATATLVAETPQTIRN